MENQKKGPLLNEINSTLCAKDVGQKLINNAGESGPFSTLFTLENDLKITTNKNKSANENVNTAFIVGHTTESNSSKDLRIFPKLSLEEADDSLCILTSEQMGHHTDLNSPNLVDITSNDLSLGILDDTILSHCALKSLKSIDLPLDMDMKSFIRSDQTPSPEELPLDPTPILITDPKSHIIINGNSNSTNSNNSFVTSITSITSLDIGYQGDGEMSRPASRGADNSPLTRRPIPRPQPRRQDPMTDSDFYTESDADMHEDHPLRGDRRAQVIDGTLYGVDPQEAADIYVNNRENMDSSGIFTDIETNTRTEDLLNVDLMKLDARDAVSPSESSTQTPTENSQNLIRTKSNDTIVTSTTPNIKSASRESLKPPMPTTMNRHTSKPETKKYKLPNRNQPSKIKAMLESNNGALSTPKKPNAKKPPGKWDAVMNKISKGQSINNLKEIKSKVFCNNVTSSTDKSKKNLDPKSTVNKL